MSALCAHRHVESDTLRTIIHNEKVTGAEIASLSKCHSKQSLGLARERIEALSRCHILPWQSMQYDERGHWQRNAKEAGDAMWFFLSVTVAMKVEIPKDALAQRAWGNSDY